MDSSRSSTLRTLVQLLLLGASIGSVAMLTLYTKTQLIYYQLQQEKGESIGDDYAIRVLHSTSRRADFCLLVIGLYVLYVGAVWFWRYVKSRKAVNESENSQLS